MRLRLVKPETEPKPKPKPNPGVQMTLADCIMFIAGNYILNSTEKLLLLVISRELNKPQNERDFSIRYLAYCCNLSKSYVKSLIYGKKLKDRCYLGLLKRGYLIKDAQSNFSLSKIIIFQIHLDSGE